MNVTTTEDTDLRDALRTLKTREEVRADRGNEPTKTETVIERALDSDDAQDYLFSVARVDVSGLETADIQAARTLCDELVIEWRHSIDVGDDWNGTVIRVTRVETHEDDPKTLVVTRDRPDKSRRYVTHVFNAHNGGFFHGDYTGDATTAMQNHDEKVRRRHRDDIHGPHPEV